VSGGGASGTRTRPTFTFEAIGVARTPFFERFEAPRQPTAEGANGVRGTVELYDGTDGKSFAHALEDLDGWEYVWLVFVFHRNVEEARGWRPKVLPPRGGGEKRGLFSTRSPHRPNPIGLSVVKLERVEGLVVHVSNIDLVDHTPVLDIKPYVPYADAYPSARTGWLEAPRDPAPVYEVAFSERARAAMMWLESGHAIDLETPIRSVLAIGPEPNPYRRIRDEGDGIFRLAVKEWRARFRVDGTRVEVQEIRSGYKERQLATDPSLDLHRAFAAFASSLSR
jgi:tRNA-Thr(GGU) m(6)t(6)A37 methyltransferase TsaA